MTEGGTVLPTVRGPTLRWNAGCAKRTVRMHTTFPTSPGPLCCTPVKLPSCPAELAGLTAETKSWHHRGCSHLRATARAPHSNTT